MSVGLPPEYFELFENEEEHDCKPKGLDLKLDLIPFVGLPRYLVATFRDLSYSQIRQNASEIISNSVALGLYTAVTSLWTDYLLNL